MISFFRINDPLRLLVILGLMFLFSIIYWLVLSPPLLQPEMIWLILGEKMAEGKMMYREIVDDTGPFAASFYWIIHLVFGKSILAHKIVAFILLFVQISIINQLFNQYKSFEVNTFVPAFIAMVLIHSSFDLLVLSPILMGSTFIVLSLAQLFSHTVLQKEGSGSVLMMGILGGVAFCFHFSLIFYLPYMLLMGIIISGFSFKQFLLAVSGFLLPFLICCTYYFWQDGLQDFFSKYLISARLQSIYTHVRMRDIAILFSVPILFSFLGVILGAVIKSLTVNQQKQLQLMLFYFIFATASFFLTNNRAPFHFVILLVPFAYFISMLHLSIKKKQFANSLSIAYLVLVLMVGYSWIVVKTIKNDLGQYAIISEPKHQLTVGKKILVLGKDLAYYKEGKQVTPYLNYNLSKGFLVTSEKHQIVSIYRHFQSEKPELVIDEEEIFSKILQIIPSLEKQYQKEGNIYLLLQP